MRVSCAILWLLITGCQNGQMSSQQTEETMLAGVEQIVYEVDITDDPKSIRIGGEAVLADFRIELSEALSKRKIDRIVVREGKRGNDSLRLIVAEEAKSKNIECVFLPSIASHNANLETPNMTSLPRLGGSSDGYTPKPH